MFYHGHPIRKKATLKWHLFKRSAEILGKRTFCYKRPGGARWVSHQLTALDVPLKNLKVMLAFSNERSLTTLRCAKKWPGLKI